MMKPPFERAIVVTLDETRTLLDAINMRRGVIQELTKASVANSRFYSGSLRDLAEVEKRLYEVKDHMEAEESYWDEKMREYEDSAREEFLACEEGE